MAGWAFQRRLCFVWFPTAPGTASGSLNLLHSVRQRPAAPAFVGAGHDFDHRVALGDFLSEHLLDRAIIRRKIRLLDRVNPEGEQRLLYGLPRPAKIRGGRGDEDVRSLLAHTLDDYGRDLQRVEGEDLFAQAPKRHTVPFTERLLHDEGQLHRLREFALRAAIQQFHLERLAHVVPCEVFERRGHDEPVQIRRPFVFGRKRPPPLRAT